MPILFYGDPHGEFAPLFAAAAEHRPEHVVLLGDLELAVPFREQMAPLLSSGVACWYVLGNHDTDDERRYGFLLDDFPEGNLGGRVVELACRDGAARVGGLGGVYKGRIWKPGAEPRFRTRAEFVKAAGKGNLWRGGLPLGQRDTIFPEDHEILAAQRADVLVCHEAPSSHRHGHGGLDGVAAAMGARLVVHGHHHQSYEASVGGIRVRGVDGREAFALSPRELA